MKKSFKFSLCLGILNMFINAQNVGLKEKPEHCYDVNNIMDRQCCILPPFFDRLTARECGAMSRIQFSNTGENVTGFLRSISVGCSYWDCVLYKYNLLDDEKNLRVQKYFDHLDQWVNLNPTFGNVMLAAKTYCKDENKMFMPIKSCEFFEFNMCIRHYVTLDCPEVVNSASCEEWKQFNEECREYFL